ncbi:hypothetical protein ScPMuIL_004216 [Solemya velum]
MSCIFYKFKNNRDYDSLTFDGLYISLLDLKKMIMQVKKLKPTEVDLQIENAQTKTAYKTNTEMIPKNTSVIVSRIPVAKAPPRDTRAQWDRYKQEQKELEAQREAESQQRLNQTADLVNAKASEADKIKAMIQQSTRDFNPDNYVKTNKYPSGPVPSTYVCFKCQQPGHFIQNCPNKPVDSGIAEVRMKRPTGIPNCFLSPASAADPGALLTYSGHFAVPTIDKRAYIQGKKERPPFLPLPPEEVIPVVRHPKEMVCQLCGDLLREAVLIPCCGTSFCDDCIRTSLLETEEHECPICHETEISPDRLTANLGMRSLVQNYLSKLSIPETKTGSSDNNLTVIDTNSSPYNFQQKPAQMVEGSDPPSPEFPPDFMYLPPQVKAAMLRERQKKKTLAPQPSIQQPPSQNLQPVPPSGPPPQLQPPPVQGPPPTAQAPPPAQLQAPPPAQLQAPPPTQLQGPPPIQLQAPPPAQLQAPPPTQTQAPPPSTQLQAAPQNQGPQESQNLPTKEQENTKPPVSANSIPMVNTVEATAEPITVTNSSGSLRQGRHHHKPLSRPDVSRDMPPGISPPSGPPLYSRPPPPGHLYHPGPRMPGPLPPRFRGPPPPGMMGGPPGFMPPRDFAPPPHLVPRPAASFPPAGLFHPHVPLPMSEREFYREKQRLINHITKKKDPIDDFHRNKNPMDEFHRKKDPIDDFHKKKNPIDDYTQRRKNPMEDFSNKKKENDPMDDFARKLNEKKREANRKKASPSKRSRSRSWSKSPRSRYRSRSKSFSRSPLRPKKKLRSKTRSRTKSKTRSRSRTPKKIRSRTRSRTRSPMRSRSRSLSRSRYWSHSPPRLRSRSRSRGRYRSRSRSFRPRSLSPKPRTRSRSRSRSGSRPRNLPPRYRNRSRSYTPKKRFTRSRTASRSPPRKPFSPYRGHSRSLSPPPLVYPRPPWESTYRSYRGPPLPQAHRYSPEKYPPGYPAPYSVPPTPPPPPPPLPPEEFYRMGPRAFEEYLRDYYSRFPHPANPPEYSKINFPEQVRARSPRRPRSWSPSGPMKVPRDKVEGRGDRSSSRRHDKHIPDHKIESKLRPKQTKENKVPEKSKSSSSKLKEKSRTKKSDTEKVLKTERKKKEKRPEDVGKVSKKSQSEITLKSHPKVEKKLKSSKIKDVKEKDEVASEERVETLSNNFERIKEKPVRKQKSINTSVLVPIREAVRDEYENMDRENEPVQEDLEKDNAEAVEQIKMEKPVLDGKAPKNKSVEKIKKLKLKHSKSKTLSGSEGHTSDSASDMDKKRKKRKLKQLIGISESSVTEDEYVSPTKRVKTNSPVITHPFETEGSEPPPPGTEEVSMPAVEPSGKNQTSKKVSLEKSVKVKEQLMLDPPELSKWERDDVDSDHSEDVSTSNSKQLEEKKSLPRSVIESAEKALVMKPLRSSTVSSTVIVKPQRKVYLDEEMTKKPERPKMIPRQTMMQITFSSAGSNKRKVSESDSEQKEAKSSKEIVSKNKENKSETKERRSVMERLGKQRPDQNSKTETDRRTVHKEERAQSKSNSSREERIHSRNDRDKSRTEHERDVRTDREKDTRSIRKEEKSQSKTEQIRTDRPVSRDTRNDRHLGRSSRDKEARSQGRNEYVKEQKNPTKNDNEKEFHQEDYKKSGGESEKLYSKSERSHFKSDLGKTGDKSERFQDKVPQKSQDISKSIKDKQINPKSDRLDRKESVVDESKFEPDYEDSSGSESAEETSQEKEDQRLVQSNDSDSGSSDDDSPNKKSRSDDEKERKKNRKSKHKKHKKHKHKHKKKKHKKHKEEKSSG